MAISSNHGVLYLFIDSNMRYEGNKRKNAEINIEP